MFANDIFWAAFWAWLCAQVLKLFWDLAVHRRLDFARLIGAGGMPSSHAALVSGLSAAVITRYGWDNPLAAICLVFSLIVMYDAAGVRRAVGKQARILNQLLASIQHGGPKGQEKKQLKELLGHTPVEVLAGAVLGATIAWWLVR